MTYHYHIEIEPTAGKVRFVSDDTDRELATYPIILAEIAGNTEPIIPLTVLLAIEAMSEEGLELTDVVTVEPVEPAGLI